MAASVMVAASVMTSEEASIMPREDDDQVVVVGVWRWRCDDGRKAEAAPTKRAGESSNACLIISFFQSFNLLLDQPTNDSATERSLVGWRKDENEMG